jgi:hypothetical protein
MCSRSQNAASSRSVSTSPPRPSTSLAGGAHRCSRSIFDRVPGAGRWSSALLLDGNVGIGGHPAGLLVRVASLLRPGGAVLVELEPPGTAPAAELVRLDLGGVEGPWFPWSAVDADGLSHPAAVAGLAVEEVWPTGDRWFGALRRA